MAVDGDFANFRAVYDELTDEVERSSHIFVSDHLRNWLQALDTTSNVAPIIKRLEAGVNYLQWRTNLAADVTQTITFPAAREQALGIKLHLARAFADKKEDVATFGFAFMRQGRSIEDNARGVIQQIFMPMARDLRRYLETHVGQVPAADRVVPLDHNSAAYREVTAALERLEDALRASNEYSDQLEKGQRIAEVSASCRLLEAAQVRIEALATLLRPVIVQFTQKVKDNLITAAALAVSTAIIAWLGHIF